ncbi:lysosomal cobalamin transporter ABCD4-like [Clytia hemisphaerica]|uniref:lysosomal cobalamin transporter ABCD4-like n=1 Tax=Clytia hemisphaerica TaxID=252671 RepID=UPI0034D40B56
MADKKQQSYALDSLFYRRFKACITVISSSDSFLMLTMLLGLSIGQQLVIFNVGILPSNFMEVLGDKNKTEMKSLLIKAFTLIVTIALFNSALKAVSGYLYLHWRKLLTIYLHKNYLQGSIHYALSSSLTDVKIDNVDQRITQDVDRLCTSLSTIIGKIVISPLIILYYSIKCFHATGATGPLIIYAYFLIGTFMNKLIMSFIVNLVYNQEAREGDFRFKHMKIRSFSESIAIIGSEIHELFKVNQCLNRLLPVQRSIVNAEIILNISINFIDYLGSMISYFVISIPIFAGKYDNLTPVQLSAVISKNAFVSMYLINCFSTLVDLSTQITDISGYCHRIGELIETMNDENSAKQDNKQHVLVSQKEDGSLIKISNLTYTSPVSGDNLLSGLNLEVFPKRNLLILGRTGIGKSSLFRILRDLWQPVRGSVTFSQVLFSKENSIMFLPQMPIFTNGSLLEQIIYPNLIITSKRSHKMLDKVERVLDDVGLTSLIDRAGGLDVNPYWDWERNVSPGEMQRLTFARLFYHRPKLVFLDEATSSMGLSEEECFYRYCEQLDITFVSISHHDSLKEYHHNYLKINEGGSWEYGEL